MVDWAMLAVPFVYIGVLVGSLVTFSNMYRKRKADEITRLKPWFPEQTPQAMYETLALDAQQAAFDAADAAGDSERAGAILDGIGGDGITAAAVPWNVRMALLLRRLQVNLNRLRKLQRAAEPMEKLVKSGVLNEEIVHRHRIAISQLQEDVNKVLTELQKFTGKKKQDLKSLYLQMANQMSQNETVTAFVDRHLIYTKSEAEAFARITSTEPAATTAALSEMASNVKDRFGQEKEEVKRK